MHAAGGVLVGLEHHQKVQQEIGVDVRANTRARRRLLENILVNHEDVHGLQCYGQIKHGFFGGRSKGTV